MIFNAEAEVAQLKRLASIRRRPSKQSRLTRYESQLLALHKAGATAADLQRWLRAKNIRVVHTTVSRWLNKHG